jgi:hypothetical protein
VGYRLDPTGVCLTCDDKNCATCNTSNGLCTECAPGFFIDKGTCRKCSGSCLKCTSPTNCLTCDNNSMLINNACECTSDNFVADASGTCVCDPSMYLTVDGRCVTCNNAMQYCSTCQGMTGPAVGNLYLGQPQRNQPLYLTCSSCPPNMWFDPYALKCSFCVQASEGCQACDPVTG